MTEPIIVTRLEKLLDVLPESVTISGALLHNLAVLSLATDGYIKITGFSGEKLESENTQKGRDRMIAQFVEKMKAKG